MKSKIVGAEFERRSKALDFVKEIEAVAQMLRAVIYLEFDGKRIDAECERLCILSSGLWNVWDRKRKKVANAPAPGDGGEEC